MGKDASPIIPPLKELFPPTETPPVGVSGPQEPMKASGTPTPQVITVRKVVKQKNTLDGADWRQWGKEFLIYCIVPTAIVFLTTLQIAFNTHHSLPTAEDLMLATGTAYGTFIGMLINLLGKFQQGI